ncbi:helix-turn-helix transcriptional regulator [Thermodesulfovibrio hydrogeniphilus]
MSDMKEKKLLTVDEVARMLSLSKQSIYQLVFYRKIPVIRLSKRALRFDPEAIERWLKEKTVDVDSTQVSLQITKREKHIGKVAKGGC